MRLLQRLVDLVKRHRDQQPTEHVEQTAKQARVAWVRLHYPAGPIRGRANEAGSEGVIDPLPDADEEQPEEQQKRVGVRHRVELEYQRRCSACGAPYDEDLVPLIELEPGWEFVHAPQHTTGRSSGTSKASDLLPCDQAGRSSVA